MTEVERQFVIYLTPKEQCIWNYLFLKERIYRDEKGIYHIAVDLPASRDSHSLADNPRVIKHEGFDILPCEIWRFIDRCTTEEILRKNSAVHVTPWPKADTPLFVSCNFSLRIPLDAYHIVQISDPRLRVSIDGAQRHIIRSFWSNKCSSFKKDTGQEDFLKWAMIMGDGYVDRSTIEKMCGYQPGLGVILLDPAGSGGYLCSTESFPAYKFYAPHNQSFRALRASPRPVLQSVPDTAATVGNEDADLSSLLEELGELEEKRDNLNIVIEATRQRIAERKRVMQGELERKRADLERAMAELDAERKRLENA